MLSCDVQFTYSSKMDSLNYEQLASEILRSLRAHRSQVAFSRRLKYKSNVSYLWESGRNWPTAAVFFWAASRVGTSVTDALARFYRTTPNWLDATDFHTCNGVARLLEDLRGDTPILQLAARTGRSRYAVARWLKGQAEPRLPDFLRMIEATSQRLLDFVAQLVDIETLPNTQKRWQELQAARELVGRLPWTPAVLLVMQTEDYLNSDEHQEGWIAHRLGIPLEVERECMSLLKTSGRVRVEGRRLRVMPIQSIDTRSDPAAGRRLREWWARVGLQYIEEQRPGIFSFNVFSVSEVDYQRLQEMHRNYYRSMRSVIAVSKPEQRVVVANVQLFALDEARDDI